MIEIDGSHGEGGGQVFRTAIGMSALTGQAVRVSRIRAARKNPGLSPQHLASLDLISKMTAAHLRGNHLGSTEVTFRPGAIMEGRYRQDIGTAGSIPLLLQAALLPALHADGPVIFDLKGGTDVKWSPTIDYFENVFLEHLRSMLFHVVMDVVGRGFFPRGGGEVRVETAPTLPTSFEPGKTPGGVKGRIFVHGLPEHIAERMAKAVNSDLEDADVELEARHGEPGTGLALWTKGLVLGADALGQKGVPAEEVGHQASEALKAEIASGSSIDVYASDMMVPYIAIHGGEYIARELTPHAKTCVDIVNAFLPWSMSIEKLERGYRFWGKGREI